MLGDIEARLIYRTWLMGMKEKFMEKKEVSGELSAGYLKEGEWTHK